VTEANEVYNSIWGSNKSTTTSKQPTNVKTDEKWHF
jgi:hypothetical protein